MPWPAVVAATPDVHLLDRTSDVDHNRSVLTFAGEAEAVAVAMEGAVEVAIAQIDMEQHEGQHPRIGAVDVIPFVPLGETTMDECVELARRFGAHIAERFELPVYLYAKAATRAERIILADIRKPQYEGLKTEISHLGREPDFGPARMHPSAGAVAVGARPFLIAFNINLESSDVDLAKRIAHRIRERSGGLPRVQALGLYLDDIQRRAGLDEPARSHGHADLAGLGDGSRPGRRRGRRRRASRSSSGWRRWPRCSTSPTTSAWRPRDRSRSA